MPLTAAGAGTLADTPLDDAPLSGAGFAGGAGGGTSLGATGTGADVTGGALGATLETTGAGPGAFGADGDCEPSPTPCFAANSCAAFSFAFARVSIFEPFFDGCRYENTLARGSMFCARLPSVFARRASSE